MLCWEYTVCTDVVEIDVVSLSAVNNRAGVGGIDGIVTADDVVVNVVVGIGDFVVEEADNGVV